MEKKEEGEEEEEEKEKKKKKRRKKERKKGEELIRCEFAGLTQCIDSEKQGRADEQVTENSQRRQIHI